LAVFDVLKVQKGRALYYVKHEADTSKKISSRVPQMRGEERDAGLSCLGVYLQKSTSQLEGETSNVIESTDLKRMSI
jgi:hypothetical protein